MLPLLQLIMYGLFVPGRIASVSKIFPTIMLYKLWEEGKVTSLDDPLERYAQSFTIKNPLGRLKESEQRYSADGLIFLEKGSLPLKPSPVTLRRMASQLSGEGLHAWREPVRHCLISNPSMALRPLRWSHTMTSLDAYKLVFLQKSLWEKDPTFEKT